MSDLVVSTYRNRENERLTIERCDAPAFLGEYLLCIHDDMPPRGSGIKAPMLLDRATAAFLIAELRALFGDESGEVV